MNYHESWELCSTAVWDLDLLWNSPRPHLTPCFQHSILSAIPCGSLLLMSFFNMYFCFSTKPVIEKYPRTLLYLSKIVLNILLIGVNFIQFFYMLHIRVSGFTFIPLINFIGTFIRLMGVLIALTLLMRQHKTGVLNSKRLFFFWFMATICEFFSSPIFNLITDSWVYDISKFTYILGTISLAICFNQLFFSVFSDPEYRLLFKATEDEYIIEHQPILSRLLFSWINRLILCGYKSNIQMKDFDHLHPQQRSLSMNDKFQNYWSKEIAKYGKSLKNKFWKGCRSEPSLFLVIMKVIAPWLLIEALLEFMSCFVNLVPAIILDAMIKFTGNVQEPGWHGFIYAFLLFLFSVIGSLLTAHTMYYIIYGTVGPKVCLPAAIYRKAIRLSSAARRNYTVGELCNLISVDSQKYFNLLFSINLVWTSPFRVALILTLLWQYLGVACLAGMAVLLLIMPITLCIASKTSGYQEGQMKRKDTRLRQMNEMLNGIKVLKLFAWELAFMDRISEIRKKEVITIKKISLLNAAESFLWIMAPFVVAITSFVTFLFMDENNVLTPSIAFVSLALFNRLRIALTEIPEVVNEFIQVRVSSKRLQTYFLSDEIKEDNIGNDVPEGMAVIIENAYFAWTSETREKPFLRDITVKISEGKLIGIIGSVGSGKSAFLSSLLGEMHKISGKINIKKGPIAYVSQQAWIQNATLQDNILFLKSMNKNKYDDVIDRCCLKDDLQMLPFGDQTEIGEKGVNLSGGQKQRVSLARALYQDADIYFLDDPLSAVDSHVGAHIFGEIIGPTGLLNNKTRILVTHDLSLLPEMDMILVMSDGEIEEMGTYTELLDNGKEFSKFVEEHLRTRNESNNESNYTSVTDNGYKSTNEIVANEVSNVPPKCFRPVEELKEKIKRGESTISRRISKQDTQNAAQTKKSDTKLIEKEKMEEGRVKAAIFITYFRNATFHLIIFILFSYITFQGFEIGSNYWLSAWSTDDSNDTKMRNLRISIYGLFGLCQGLCMLAASFLLAVGATRASRSLHAKMLFSILRSPMSFFEKTPLGRILNRFGKDVDTMDMSIPSFMNRVILSGVSLIAVIVVVLSNSPIFVLVILPFIIFCVYLQHLYMIASRQSRRILSTSMSPVVSNFSETIQGTSTIRAFKAQKFFIQKDDDFVDTYYRTLFACFMLNRWVSLRLEMVTNIFVLAVSLYIVTQREIMDAGMAGLIMSYVLNMSAGIALLTRLYAAMEINMISIERISEYSKLEPEASWESSLFQKHWLNEGKITFENYQMKYQKSNDLVLKGINVTISPKEKVGIVGRTGAGKSSLVAGLFRIVEPCGGKILIDNVDISSLGLHELRAHITIIPQDPVLFSGSLRLNLDPLNEYSDEKLWSALEHAHLKNFITSLETGLEYSLTEGGDNISVGQRQQMCLARALLKKTKILVLDEATAAVDLETDKLIQATIREEFSDSTILTIAHRIYTILDYDRILVMSDGNIAEEGTPNELLEKENSLFSQFAKDAGLL